MSRSSGTRVRAVAVSATLLMGCIACAPGAWAQGGDDDPAGGGKSAASKTAESLSDAARDGNLARVKALLARGANVNARGAGQHTALMAAASYGEAEMVRFLLSKGADPNLKDAEGRTALARARENNHAAVVAVLQSAGGRAPAAAPVANRAVAAAPAPRPARVAARPAPAAAPARVIRLPRLAPRRGHVIGRAVFADGRPVPSFTVQALGFYGKVHLGPTGTLPFLGDHKKATNGRYAIRTRDYAYTKEPVDALVSSVSGLAHVMYRGKEYALRLHPIDGKVDGSDPKGYRGRSGPGAVRDFVLKMSGVRPGYEVYKTPLTGVEDNGGMMNTFYGGTVNVSLAAYEAGTTDLSKSHPPGSVVTLTFTPLGPLMDGSAGRVVTRTYRFAEKGLNWSFVTRDIPLGAYTATATLTEPGGASYPLRLKVRSGGGDYASSQVIAFPPYALYLGGVEREDMTLTR